MQEVVEVSNLLVSRGEQKYVTVEVDDGSDVEIPRSVVQRVEPWIRILDLQNYLFLFTIFPILFDKIIPLGMFVTRTPYYTMKVLLEGGQCA